ncbi:hypothetical protein BJ165DRAFT_1520408 [Panaeolus papilionaceus]|nr:hypothetical protein BJ165DRAFT_1520408 [Panaeolus papilionaceus]
MLTANSCLPEDVNSQLLVRSASTAAAFTVLVWEYLVTWKSEVQYIWSHNLFLVLGGPMKHLPVQDASTCVRFILPSLVAARFLLNMLDAILMLELYALYNRNKFVASVLVLLFLGLLTSEIIVGYYNLGRTHYNCICDVVQTHSTVLFFAVTIWIVHLNLGALLVATRRLSKSDRPLVKLCCRLIINMQKLHHDQALEQWANQGGTSDSEPPLDDIISLDHEDGDEQDVEAKSSSSCAASMVPSDSEVMHKS